MLKNLLILGTILLLLSGCNANKQPVEKKEVKKETELKDKSNEVTQNEVKKEVQEEEKTVVSQNKKRNIPFSFYKIIPSQIEVFSYSGLRSNTVIDDTKLDDSFYLKGKYIRIERILTSQLGDKYGKIAGKGLLVSMDDLGDKKE